MNTLSDRSELIASLRALVLPHLRLIEENEEIAESRSLSEAGLDSMSSINLLLDIEDQIGVTIADELIEEDSFETLAKLADLVARSTDA